MIVRCGRCQVELEVAGPGEFICPSCGTRNAVRGAADPFGVPDLGAAATPSTDAAPGVRWVDCPACGYRFALGEVEEVACPSCAARLTVSPDGVRQDPASS